MAAAASHSAGGHHSKSKPGKLILWTLAIVAVLVGLAFIISKASKNSKLELMTQTSMATTQTAQQKTMIVYSETIASCNGSYEYLLRGGPVYIPGECGYSVTVSSGEVLLKLENGKEVPVKPGTKAHLDSKLVSIKLKSNEASVHLITCPIGQSMTPQKICRT